MERNELVRYIDFKTNGNFANYLKYQKVRSKEIYYFVSKWLHKYYEELKIDYEIVNDWIRYDKSVKDTLYVFISTFEEHFKASLLEKVLYKNDEFVLRNDDNQNVNENIWKILNEWNKFTKSKIGYYQSILIFFTNKKYKELLLSINENFKQKEIKKVNELRNRVMHFSFLMLPINESIEDFDQLNSYFKKLKGEIETLKNLLPKPWNRYFVDEFNDCAKSSDEKHEKTIDKKIDKKILIEVKI